MNNQDQVPTIAELWDRFQKLGNYIETEKFLQSWGTKGSDGLSHDGRNHSADEIELQSLRQQLLERSETEWGMQIREIISDGIPALRVIFDHGVLFLDSNDSKELGACIQFGSWELQQREKESSGD